jgi:nucleoside-diphosphate-sugar epimerase
MVVETGDRKLKGKRALVTGGLGFIGSNLATRLVELGASVTIVDSSVEGCGANLKNIAAVRDQVRLLPFDIGEAARFEPEIRSSDLIFNLAGEISHIRSMQSPERDLALNAIARLRFLDVCRRVRAGVRIVYAGTRQVYGRPTHVPVSEDHALDPIDFNGIHKLAAAHYHLLLSARGEIDAAVLRLTNIYGPRMALRFSWQGVLGVFIRAALMREPVLVYGDGKQYRDPLHVDDVVTAFIAAATAERLPSRIYNVGGPAPLPLSAIAAHFAREGGCPTRLVPFPNVSKAIDIGDYYADWRRIRHDLGWRPKVQIAEGARRTLNYYRSCLECYLDCAPKPLTRAQGFVSAEPVAAQ